MAEYRRKTFYIDRIFQRKFLVLFMLLCVLGTAANVGYLCTYLKDDAEANLYRARFVIANVNEIIAEHVVVFNAAVMALTAALAAFFYLLVRRRVQQVAAGIGTALEARTLHGAGTPAEPVIPTEFEDLHGALAGFFATLDKQLQKQRSALAAVQQFVAAPDDQTRHTALVRLGRL